MKKSFRKLLCLALAVVMVTSVFTACSKKKDNAAKKDTFYIGGMGPISGSAAVYGTAVKNAAQLAVDEINAAGGINGYKIAFNFVDDEADKEKGINAYNVLKEWGMQMVMGAVTSGSCVAVADKADIDGMFLLTPSGSAVECITSETAFQVCFNDPNQGAASATYIGENDLAEKVAVIYDSSDVYSSGIYEKFMSQAKADKKFEVVYEGSFTKDNNSDFSVQLTAAKDSGATLVFLPIYYSEASSILTQADSMGYDPKFFGCDGLDGILTVENFNLELAEGVLLLTPFAADATDDKTVNFVTKYKEKYNETPNQFAADAYDAIYIIKAAIENAKVTPDMDIDEIGEKLATAMTKISFDGLTGEDMTWTADGAVNKAPKAVVIEDGVYVSYSK